MSSPAIPRVLICALAPSKAISCASKRTDFPYMLNSVRTSKKRGWRERELIERWGIAGGSGRRKRNRHAARNRVFKRESFPLLHCRPKPPKPSSSSSLDERALAFSVYKLVKTQKAETLMGNSANAVADQSVGAGAALRGGGGGCNNRRERRQ